MKKIFFPLLLVLFFLKIQAQTSPELFVKPDDAPILSASDHAAQFAATITAEQMKSYLEVLASDEFEGRETGTEGQRKAADFIAAHFKKLGLPAVGEDNGYFQYFTYTSETWQNGQIELNLNDRRYRHASDFVSFPYLNSDRPSYAANEVVFLGYGIDDPKYSDYQGVKVKGRVILIFQGEPVDERGVSRLSGTNEPSPWAADWEKKLEVAYRHGVNTVLFIEDDISKVIRENRSLLSYEMQMLPPNQAEDRYPNNAFVSNEVANAIFGAKLKTLLAAKKAMDEQGKPASMSIACKLEMSQKKNSRRLDGSNVLGFIEGSDSILKEEVVIVSAHYDHLGKRGNSIYYGADDNASGSSALMAIAAAFAEAKRQGYGPRRSVLCLSVSGEEKGLLGSAYYAGYPIFSLDKTVADVNVDMIGRTDKKHEGDPNYIYVIGSDRLSAELHAINEAANAAFTQLALDYTFNAEDDPNRFYYRSDHYNFAKRGIPSVFFFSGIHKDYHRPSDTPDKIMYPKMEKIARLIFHTSWELANRDERIKVDVKQKD